MNHFHQLLAQTDGVALGDKDNSVEGGGNDEDRKVVRIGQLHVLNNLFLNGFIQIDTVGDGVGKFSKLFRVKIL